jgi:hypothetical protein
MSKMRGRETSMNEAKFDALEQYSTSALLATAVYGHATRATPNEFSGFPKIKPVAGQSPLTPTADHRTRRPAELA